ncbi:MAG: transglycosylase SLT domain-containing protein [Gammaproteobacteria bacterium]|nr:transglycosylase SLT domain-containing protein [Gammaproteobacteria bacterium]
MAWLTIGILVLAVAGSASARADRAQERETFREGWAAAARGDQSATLQAILALPDYPLAPYLEFELLRQRVDKVPEDVFEKFLARYRDWSFHPALERAWLRSLGRRGLDDALVRHGRDSSDAEVRCHVARADLAAGRLDGLVDRILDLWLVGQSQVDACDPVFAWWRRQGELTPDRAWRRFHRALEAGETGLGRYLRRYMNADQRVWADRWLALVRRVDATLGQARSWPDHAQTRLIVLNGIKRLARSDHERAEWRWSQFDNRFDWSSADRQALNREIALFKAVALEPGAVAAIDRLDASVVDQQMLEWRARAAMATGDWGAVLGSIQAMALSEQARGRWRYWRGRALADLQRPEAAMAYASLAGETNYYGFLAASRLGLDLTLCNRDLVADAAVQRRLMRDAEFERALELNQVGLDWHARRTWWQVSRRLSRDELRQAALLAAARGWHDRVIRALGDAGALQAYAWRFPLVEKGEVTRLAGQHAVDPALVFGLMRAESAMQTDALSPAGARGLLQLMPATAGAVARRHQISYQGRSQLYQPLTNIALGVAHLGELQSDFQRRWIHVAAAYNAGANAVRRWLDTRPLTDADVWLETLPYFETRDYVPRVLTFATLYEWQLQRPPEVLGDHVLPGIAPRSQQFTCPASR